MDRREFFTRTRKKNSVAYTGYRRTDSGLTPYNGPWTINEVSHLLKRTLFGAKKADIDHFLGMTPGQAVDELVGNVLVAAPPLRDYGPIRDEEDGMLYEDVGVELGATWVDDPNTLSSEQVRGTINGLRKASLKKWWSGLIINQNRGIQEKMVMFWHHHFSVQESEVDNSQFLYRHHDLLRRNALGNVKTLAREVTIDPAMLLHLNGYLNSKQAPDENFAREFQELFTIGKGVDSGYTEDDVIAAARVLTGWRINDDPLNSYFESGSHDTGSKTFSAFYNNTSISGSTDGEQELDAFVNMVFSTTEASRYFCRKIYKWFVYYDIDDATEVNVIAPLAAILKDNNYEVVPMLTALFKSEHFFDAVNQSCYIKNPFDIIAGTLREFGVPFPAYTDYINGYPLFNKIYEHAADMQQQLFQPPDVSGWPSYHQDPMNYELWVNSNSLPHRANFTNALVNDELIDLRAFVAFSSNPADPDQLISDTTELLLRYPLSANSKTYVKTTFLLNNTTDNTIWTNAWNANNTTVINASLKELFKFIMNLPEFHLC